MLSGPLKHASLAAALLWCMLWCCAAWAEPAGQTSVQANGPSGATPASTAGTTSSDSEKPSDKGVEKQKLDAAGTSNEDEAGKTADDNPDKRLIFGKGRATDTGSGDRPGVNLLSMLWPLLLVLAGIALLFWAARKYLPGVRRLTGSRAAEVLARTHLSPRQSINIIKLGRRILVVGQTGEQLSPLGSITDPEEVSELIGLCESAGGGSATSRFRKVFQRMDSEFSAADAEAAAGGDEELRRVRGELDSLTEKVRRVSGGREKPSE